MDIQTSLTSKPLGKLALALLLTLPIIVSSQAGQEPKLSALSLLKAENLRLRTQLTQCRVDLLDAQSKIASTDLTSLQSRLEQEFRKELQCKDTDKFDWVKLKCDVSK